MSKRPGIAAGLVLVSVLTFGSVVGADIFHSGPDVGDLPEGDEPMDAAELPD